MTGFTKLFIGFTKLFIGFTKLFIEFTKLFLTLSKPSLRKIFVTDSPYSYLLLLCTIRNFDNSIFVIAIHFGEKFKNGKVNFPGKVLTLTSPQIYILKLIFRATLRVLVRFFLQFKHRLSPLSVYAQEHAYLVGFTAINYTLIHEGSGYRIRKHFRISHHKDLTRAVDRMRGYISAYPYPNFWDVPHQQLRLRREIPKRLDLLTKCFPDLKDGVTRLKHYKKVAKLAVVFTQCMHRDGYVSLEAQKRIYSGMINTLLSYGYKVLIRKHPRDEQDYGEMVATGKAEVLGGYFPGEVVAALLPDALIISAHSTITEVMADYDHKAILLGFEWMRENFRAKINPKVKVDFTTTGDVDKKLIADLLKLKLPPDFKD